jgi:Domain of unknown function (DUF1707)/Cell wall-active antibiotics response 4TMS YvqF
MVGFGGPGFSSGGLERPGRPVPPSGMRASDADREAVVEVLREAVTHGRLTFDEFEERTAQAYAAKTFGELAPLTTDLPTGAAGPALPSINGRPLVAVLSTDSRTGRWLVPARFRVSAVLGTVELDFCEAVLSSREIVIDARVVLGSITLVVPDGLHVRVHGTSVLSSRSSRKRRSPAPEIATIDIHGAVVLGNVEVRAPSKKRRRELGGSGR